MEDVGSLLEICPENVKEQMMMRLDHIGENHENLKVKVVSYTTNKTEQAQGGQTEVHVPKEVDYVSDSEQEEEDWQESKGIDILHLSDDGIHVGEKARTKGKAETETRDTPKEQGQDDVRRREDLEDTHKGRTFGKSKKLGIPRTCGRIRHRPAQCRWGDAGVEEEDADCRS